MNTAYHHTLDAAAAVHNETALRLMSMQEARGVTSLRDFAAMRFCLSDEEEAMLHSGFEAQVQKVLAILAIMIDAAEHDTAVMNDLIDILGAISGEGFDPEACPLKAAEEFVFSYLEKMI